MASSEALKTDGGPVISVIIPVYNVQNYLKRCLQSVSDQDYTRFEAILVDDGSRDQSGALCDEWAEKDPRFKVYHKENGGLSSARNFGLDRCTGEYICFADSDDYLEPTCLSYLYGLIRRTGRCRVSQANHNIIRKNRVEKNDNGDLDAVLNGHDAAEAVLFHDRVDVSACGKLYHRSVFDGLRFPENRLYEDTYLFAEVLEQTEEYVYGHLPQYHYVMNAGSIVNSAFSARHLEYIEAAERLAGLIRARYPDLETGCVRRVNHARLSVLRYMENCADEHKKTRADLRRAILRDAKYYIRDPRTPRRDRAAVLLLKLGLKPFYFGWKLYTRGREG